MNRGQRAIARRVMEIIESDGFVLGGGLALVESGRSTRPTDDMDAFSARCDDVSAVIANAIGILHSEGFDIVVHRDGPSFGRLVISKGRFRRSELKVELGRDSQMWPTEPSSLGPRLSVRELAANKMLAAFGRAEPRDLADLHSLHLSGISMDAAMRDAAAKDSGFSREVLAEMIQLSLRKPNSIWPRGVEAAEVRRFGTRLAEAVNAPPPNPFTPLAPVDPMLQQRASKASNSGATWVAPHTRNGRHVAGHYRKPR